MMISSSPNLLSSSNYAVQSLSPKRPTAFTDAQLVKQLNEIASILNQTDRLSSCARGAASRLKQALIELEVRQLRFKAIAQGVWDFYPTPTPVINKMIAIADLKTHHKVLEPSAGCGDLATAIAKAGVNQIDCFEINSLLRTALQLQQFNLIGSDFLTTAPDPTYDRVISNPPLSSNGVANHTMHAYRFLKPAGKLITLAHHYKFKPSQSDRYFFTWLKHHHAKFLNLGAAFSSGERKTSIPLQIISISKP